VLFIYQLFASFTLVALVFGGRPHFDLAKLAVVVDGPEEAHET